MADVPAEVLITSMRSHQKYFSLLKADGTLAPRFIVISNMEANDGGKAVVGNFTQHANLIAGQPGVADAAVVTG